MPRYIIERSIPRLSRDQLFEVGRRSVAVLADMPDVRWIRSYVSDVDGKIYCEYDAPVPKPSGNTPGERDFPSIGSRKSPWRSTRACSCSASPTPTSASRPD
jgi:Nickel responsive protein SCO4226-like